MSESEFESRLYIFFSVCMKLNFLREKLNYRSFVSLFMFCRLSCHIGKCPCVVSGFYGGCMFFRFTLKINSPDVLYFPCLPVFSLKSFIRPD